MTIKEGSAFAGLFLRSKRKCFNLLLLFIACFILLKCADIQGDNKDTSNILPDIKEILKFYLFFN